MGSVFKPKVTRPIPTGATFVVRDGKQWAEWRDATGRLRRAQTTGKRAKRPGVIVEAATFTAKYRDGAGFTRKVATGCRSREAAKKVLARLESDAERVRAGVLSTREAIVAEHIRTPIMEHVNDYVAALSKSRGKGARARVSASHVTNVRRGLVTIIEACGFETLQDLDRQKVLDWAADEVRRPVGNARATDGAARDRRPPGPRTINAKLIAMIAFGNWLVAAERLLENPFQKLKKLDQSDDIRRKRRALTTDEFGRLLTVAGLRPLAEHGRATVRRNPAVGAAKTRATWKKAPLTVETIEAAADRGRAAVDPSLAVRLELEGWERALTYETMLTTGMRKGEVASLTIADVDLSEERPSITLSGPHAKNGKRSVIPLRKDVASHLREWIDDRRRRSADQGQALPPEAPLFYVPTGLIRIFDRDLAAAGIPKVDERGHRLDVHAMRTTFNTHLAVAGVSPRTAMAAMRVSSLDLVLKTYADDSHFDVANAVNSLPAPPEPSRMLEAVGSSPPANPVVPIVVPTSGKRGSLEGSAGSRSPSGKKSARAKNARNTRQSEVFPAKPEKRAKGLEPSTSSLGS